MERAQLLHYVAPCSLLCYTCPALKDGAVSECAAKLCRYFEGYYDFNDANMPEQYRSWLPQFEDFYKRLEGYTQSKCPGCRNTPSASVGCIDGCVVPKCISQRGIDFCAECSDFPCHNAKDFFGAINSVIAQDWESGNKRIKEVGIEAYFNEKKDRSHYINYKKNRGGFDLLNKNEELVGIITKFAASGWEVIDKPSTVWLNAGDDGEAIREATASLMAAVEKADRECGTCGCEFDPLYKRALVLLRS